MYFPREGATLLGPSLQNELVLAEPLELLANP